MSENNTKRPYTDQIVVHHSVTPPDKDNLWTIQLIRETHKKNGLSPDGRMAYHWLVFANGATHEGRPIDTVGYHAGNWDVNTRSVAICCIGNFQNDHLTGQQEKTLGRLLREIKAKYNVPRQNIRLHREIKPTACPGVNITQAVIDVVLSEPSMPDAKDKRIEELIAQVKRLQEESRKLTGEVHEANGKVHDLEATVDRQETIAKNLRGEMKRKEQVILEKDKEIDELRGSVDDASQTVEDNLKKSLADRLWSWLFPKR